MSPAPQGPEEKQNTTRRGHQNWLDAAHVYGKPVASVVRNVAETWFMDLLYNKLQSGNGVEVVAANGTTKMLKLETGCKGTVNVPTPREHMAECDAGGKKNPCSCPLSWDHKFEKEGLCDYATCAACTHNKTVIPALKGVEMKHFKDWKNGEVRLLGRAKNGRKDDDETCIAEAWNLARYFAQGVASTRAGAMEQWNKDKNAGDCVIKMLAFCRALPSFGHGRMKDPGNNPFAPLVADLVELRNDSVMHPKGDMEVDEDTLTRVIDAAHQYIMLMKDTVEQYGVKVEHLKSVCDEALLVLKQIEGHQYQMLVPADELDALKQAKSYLDMHLAGARNVGDHESIADDVVQAAIARLQNHTESFLEKNKEQMDETLRAQTDELLDNLKTMDDKLDDIHDDVVKGKEAAEKSQQAAVKSLQAAEKGQQAAEKGQQAAEETNALVASYLAQWHGAVIPSKLPKFNASGFVGRTDEQYVLAHKVRSSTCVVVSGFSGQGKTTLLKWYVHEHKGKFAFVWWLDQAKDVEALASQLVALGGQMGVVFDPAANNNMDKAKAVVSVLRGKPSWLVVLDNADNAQELEDQLGLGPETTSGGGKIVVTTERPPSDKTFPDVDWDQMVLEGLDPDASLQLLLRKAKRLGRRWTEHEKELAAAKEITTQLEHHALAVAQIGIDLRLMLPSVALPELTARIAQSKEDEKDASKRIGHPTVAATLLPKLERLRQNEPEAHMILQIMSCFEPTNIPYKELFGEVFNLARKTCLFCGNPVPVVAANKCSKCHRARYCSRQCQRQHWKGASDVSPHKGDCHDYWSKDGFTPKTNEKDVINMVLLEEYGLLTEVDEVEGVANMHRLVQVVVRQRVVRGFGDGFALATYHRMSVLASSENKTAEQLRLTRIMVVHMSSPEIMAVLRAQMERIGQGEAGYQGGEARVFGLALNNLATAHGDLGDKTRARMPDLLEEALRMLRKHYGQDSDHLDIARALHNLANAHGHLGDTTKQRDLLEEALQMKRKYYGQDSDHVSIAMALHNLANAHGNLGDAKKQRDLLEEALRMYRTHHGQDSDHVDIADALLNLAIAHGALGDTMKKRGVYKEVLEMKRKHYGEGSGYVDIARTLTIRAKAYGALGHMKKRRDLLKEALRIYRKHYGQDSDHVEIAGTLHNLANAHGELGDAKKQRDLLEEALRMYRTHHGQDSDHVDIANTLHSLAKAHGALGDTMKKRDLLKQALLMSTKHRGVDDPITVQFRNELQRIRRGPWLLLIVLGVIIKIQNELHRIRQRPFLVLSIVVAVVAVLLDRLVK